MFNRESIVWWGAFLSLIVMMMISVSDAQEGDRNESSEAREARLLEETREALVGKQRPRLDVTGWMNGEVSDADMNGKFTVVQFWATWCSDSIGSIEGNNEFYERYKGWGVLFVGVCSSDKGQDKMGEKVAEFGIKYPVARDEQLASMKAWTIGWWPTYVLIDPEGVVLSVSGNIADIENVLNQIGRFAE
ncbi:Thiol-disulfide oxidoreductase ResA [Poriferisphaera corsica]|uniref:Thiol-disulfide oxidoreductase ResA n=1 Tax=Poriferisphaera corsica TaxID=2528020 RepID=A0A517YVX3_9BACT|nr:TlpA disulfide reductase family protein [Poriferisphaera corsica]QDU34370.1 Thiol-disulfide oxidoreductase ResA [Poriferisphaera corsica]